MQASPAMTHAANRHTARWRGSAKWRYAALLSLLVGLHGVNAGAREGAEGQAKDMLERMVQALRSLDYAGTFVYLYEDQLETLEITHTVQDGQEFERLVSLNGAAREVRRDQRAITCVMPDEKAVSVDQRAQGSGLWPSLNLNLDNLNGQYLLSPLGQFRIAGRQSDVVGIIPKDKFRYGYRFYLDQKTGLPLKADLMGEEGRPIEQMMFTNLNFITAGEGMTADLTEGDGFRRLLRQPPQTQSPELLRNWAFFGLPAGFSLHAYNRWADERGRAVEHFVLSDGLASVSVYVEKDQKEGLRGQSHVGAVNAWGGVVAAHQVTAVGEVPQGTVRQIVDAMRYRSKGSGG
jgi:sigma-E factor negative regulatory protein RseB